MRRTRPRLNATLLQQNQQERFMSENISMTRRGVLSGATAGVSAAALGATPTMAQTRKTFVLVHGAYYGGWSCSGALERIGDRVSSIVWLDAFKPEDGQRGTDYISEFSRKALDAA